MLEDERASALATRFASQWLRLQDAEKNHPEPFLYPDFTAQLSADLVRETELLFEHLVREDRSLLELFTADYTFINDRLARHYGIPGVSGSEFRRVQYLPDTRSGVLGHGSVLLLTSMSARTSPDPERRAGSRERPAADVHVVTDVTRAARKVGDGGADGHTPASSTAQRTGVRRHRGIFGRAASHDT
jgi:hypothetical protein